MRKYILEAREKTCFVRTEEVWPIRSTQCNINSTCIPGSLESHLAQFGRHWPASGPRSEAERYRSKVRYRSAVSRQESILLLCFVLNDFLI